MKSIELKRKMVPLNQLPIEVRQAIITSSSNISMGLDLIKRGVWQLDRFQESKEDVFVYQGNYWKHIKKRQRADDGDDYICDQYLWQVFAKQTIVYE